MTRFPWARPRAPLTTAALLLALPTASFAADFEVGDGKLRITGSAFAGTAVRTATQDSELLPNVNSSLVGIPGNAVTPSAGRNQDDGNLNFNRGDAIAKVVKTYVSADYSWQNYGAVLSGKAWYDAALERDGVPWGNVPNGYVAGATLSDAGAMSRSRFSGIVADNLYAYGKHSVDGIAIDWTVGYQKLDWGNRYIVLGGLRDLNALDIPASLRPGVQRDEETRIAMPALFARFGLTPQTSVEAFYQLAFERNAPNHCGTLFAQLDFVSEGCDKAMFGPISDRQALATGVYLNRAATQDPSNSGQFALALKHTVEPWATEFGVYAAQFHSRASFYSAIKSGRAGAPFVPNDPGNLNPEYFTEYPESIRMFGLTFETKFRGGAAFGELTYRPNQPLQYNAADLLSAFVSNVAPTPLRAQVAALAPGAVFHGYERFDAVQLQLGAVGQVPNVLGAAGLSLGGEIVYKGVPDLPDQSVARFGRADVFGQGAVNGVCPPPAAPVSCSTDGYVSKHAFGYRLRAGLRYANAFEGVDLLPSLFFGQDVSGWSGDGSILEGRFLAVASLQANFGKQWTAQLAWQPTWGGTYNNLRDRSIAQFNVGYRF